jgi:Leucine-rich repeat (LRR) protein
MELKQLQCATFTNLAKLEKLDLKRNAISTIEPGLFKILTQLRALDLNANMLKSFQFQDLQNLENLNLSDNMIFSIDGMFCGKDSLVSHKLKILSLSSNKFKTVPKNAFENVTGLRSLFLGAKETEELPPEAFNGLLNLKELSLAQGWISVFDGKHFSGLRSLRILNLSETAVGGFCKDAFDYLKNKLDVIVIEDEPNMYFFKEYRKANPLVNLLTFKNPDNYLCYA